MRTPLSHLALALALGTPALAQNEYPDVASLLEAIRSGKQQVTCKYHHRPCQHVEVKVLEATVTTPPVAWGYEGKEPYTTWFYVNDPGRNGDGVLFSLPNYYAGTNPFDDEGVDDNPWENDISIPDLKRGWSIELSGYLESRMDESGGYAIKRYELEQVDLVRDEDEESLSGSLVAVLPVHSRDELPAAPAPSGIAVAESAVRQGEVVVVSGRDLGDRARVLLDGRRLEIADRRDGLLVARIPAEIAPGAKKLVVENPLSGRSPAVDLTVVAPAPPPAPTLERATRAGKLVALRGANLAGKKVEVTVAGKPARVISRGAHQVLCELPAGANGNSKVKVTVDGAASNELKLGAAPSGPGISGSIPGE